MVHSLAVGYSNTYKNAKGRVTFLKLPQDDNWKQRWLATTARKIGFTLNLILIKVEVKYDHSLDPNFDERQMCIKTVVSLTINLILDKEEVKFDLNFDSAFDAR